MPKWSLTEPPDTRKLLKIASPTEVFAHSEICIYLCKIILQIQLKPVGLTKLFLGLHVAGLYQLRVTDLIPDALSCGGVLLPWSALSCGVWEFTVFVTLLAKRITCAQLHCFHKMQNSMLILSQDTQERITQKSLLRIVDASFSRSLALFHSLELAISVVLALSLCSRNL